MSPHDQTTLTVEQLLNPNQPPERIYSWRDSQLSLARHYGGLKYQGHDYQIDYAADGQPLVRVDVIKREVTELQRLRGEAKVLRDLLTETTSVMESLIDDTETCGESACQMASLKDKCIAAIAGVPV